MTVIVTFQDTSVDDPLYFICLKSLCSFCNLFRVSDIFQRSIKLRRILIFSIVDNIRLILKFENRFSTRKFFCLKKNNVIEIYFFKITFNNT